MTTDRETTRIVRSWLHTDEHESAVRILAAVVASLDTTPQRRAWGRAWKTYFMNATFKFAAAALAVAIAAGTGLVVYLSRPALGPGASPSPAATGPAETQLVIGPPTLTTSPPPAMTPPKSIAPTASPLSAAWALTGSMLQYATSGAPSVRLADGTVLVVGGRVELYDPSTGTWSAADIGMPSGGRPTLLADGRVLITGSTPEGARPGAAGPTAEIYDPRSGTWAATGSMNEPRRDYTTTLLLDGRVLATGGIGPNGSYDYLASAELYDPDTGVWSVTGTMSAPRGSSRTWTVASGHTATLLKNGMVLVAGGRGSVFDSLASAELWNPATGIWNVTGSMRSAREAHTATLLDDGSVLIVGNGGSELYDAITGTWTTLPESPYNGVGHTATLLPDGNVLIAGGLQSPGDPVASAALFQPNTQTWTSAGMMNTPRVWHSATTLLDGSVLVAGGEALTEPNIFAPQTSAEVFGLEPAQ